MILRKQKNKKHKFNFWKDPKIQKKTWCHFLASWKNSNHLYLIFCRLRRKAEKYQSKFLKAKKSWKNMDLTFCKITKEKFGYSKNSYRMQQQCIENAVKMHTKCNENAYRMHIKCTCILHTQCMHIAHAGLFKFSCIEK